MQGSQIEKETFFHLLLDYLGLRLWSFCIGMYRTPSISWHFFAASISISRIFLNLSFLQAEYAPSFLQDKLFFLVTFLFHTALPSRTKVPVFQSELSLSRSTIYDILIGDTSLHQLESREHDSSVSSRCYECLPSNHYP